MTTSTKRFLILLAIVGALVVPSFVHFRASSFADTSPTTTPIPAPPPPPIPPIVSSQQYSGIPGMAPSSASGANPSTVSPFTTDDVLNYWNSHTIPALPDAAVAGQAVPHRVTSVRFLTSGEVAKIVASSLGRPDSYPVVYVELQGTWAVAAPPNGAAEPDSSVVFHNAMLVLDAHTGNILLSGQVPFSASSTQVAPQ